MPNPTPATRLEALIARWGWPVDVADALRAVLAAQGAEMRERCATHIDVCAHALKTHGGAATADGLRHVAAAIRALSVATTEGT